MKRLALLLALAAPLMAQTTTNFTTSKTAAISKWVNPGINMAHIITYGVGNKFRDYGYVGNGYNAVPYFQIGWQCTTGGTQSATNFFSGEFQSSAYPANFFVGYTYEWRGVNGNLVDSGTISANTANTSSPGINFTLSSSGTPPGSGCSPGGGANSDILIVRSPSGAVQATALSCNEYYAGHTSGSCSFETTDLQNSGFLMATDCNSCTIQIPLDATIGQAQNTVSTTAQRYVNFNGSTYTLEFGADTPSSCSLSYSVAGNTTWISGSVTPTTSWQPFSFNFSASETGTQTNNEILTISTTGDCHIQYMTVIEQSVIAANTTMLRDAVWQKINALAPGSLRFMDTAGWPTDSTHLINTSYGLTGLASASQLVRSSVIPTIPYNDRLKICDALAKSNGQLKVCWLELGNWATDDDVLVNWLQSSGWHTIAAADGFEIFLGLGNEPWNSFADTVNTGGDGKTYGTMAAIRVNKIKTASGYNSAIDKIVMSGWAAASQSYGVFGWVTNMMTSAGCTLSTRTFCPDYVDVANYHLDTLDSLTDPFGDEVAENVNLMTKTGYATSGGFPSLKQSCQYFSTTWNVGCAEYEYQYSPQLGTATPTQAQMNQISMSAGNGIIEALHGLLAMTSAGSAAENMFAFGDEINNPGTGGTAMGAWSCVNLMAQGPGETAWTFDQWRPCGITYAMVNSAIATLGPTPCFTTATQTGGPIISYAGGQGGTIDSNSSQPQTFTWYFLDTCSGTPSKFALITINANATTNEPLAMTYISGTAPVGSITKTVFGGPVNALTDNVANSNLSNAASTPAPVVYPSSTTISSLSSDTLPAGSLTTYTGSLTSATPPATAQGMTLNGVKFQ